MKKILIISTILFSFFLLNENVSASNILTTSTNIFDENTDTISKNMSQTYYYYYNQSSYKTKLEDTINQIKEDYKYYYIGISSMLFWNDDDIEVYFGAINYKDSNGNHDSFSSIFYNPNNADIYELSYFYLFYNNTIINNTFTDKILNRGIVYQSYNSKYKSGSTFVNNSTYINNSYFAPQKYSNVNVKFDSSYYCQTYENNQYITCNYAYDTINFGGITYTTGDYINFMGPTLKLKETFNSGTNAYAMKKIGVEFQENDAYIKNNQVLFKIQVGANDFIYNNTPFLNHYKIYGRNSDAETWQEIELDKNYGDEETSLIYSITNFNEEIYDNNDGTVAENVYTFTFNTTKEMCIYTYFKIEFYFDNTNNYYLYMYDSLENSIYYDLGSFLENYTYYKFDKSYRYAFISTTEENISEKIYFPYHAFSNDDVNLRGYYYNYEENKIDTMLKPNVYIEHDYYYYFHFDIESIDKKIIALTKYKNNLDTYFYIPNNMYVSFSNNKDDDFTIYTPNGSIINDTNNIQDDNVYEDEVEHGALYNILVKPFIDYFDRNLPIIGQIGTIISNMSFEEHEEIPPIEMDLSFLGINQKVSIIDIEVYKDIREPLFLFEYIAILWVALPKLIANLRSFFGGAS